jgi:hypothetical protein
VAVVNLSGKENRVSIPVVKISFLCITHVTSKAHASTQYKYVFLVPVVKLSTLCRHSFYMLASISLASADCVLQRNISTRSREVPGQREPWCYSSCVKIIAFPRGLPTSSVCCLCFRYVHLSDYANNVCTPHPPRCVQSSLKVTCKILTKLT